MEKICHLPHRSLLWRNSFETYYRQFCTGTIHGNEQVFARKKILYTRIQQCKILTHSVTNFPERWPIGDWKLENLRSLFGRYHFSGIIQSNETNRYKRELLTFGRADALNCKKFRRRTPFILQQSLRTRIFSGFLIQTRHVHPFRFIMSSPKRA